MPCEEKDRKRQSSVERHPGEIRFAFPRRNVPPASPAVAPFLPGCRREGASVDISAHRVGHDGTEPPKQAGARSCERAPGTHRRPIGPLESVDPAPWRAKKHDARAEVRGAPSARSLLLVHVSGCYQNGPLGAAPIWVKRPGNLARKDPVFLRREGFFDHFLGEDPEAKRARSCERAPRTNESKMRTESIRGVPFPCGARAFGPTPPAWWLPEGDHPLWRCENHYQILLWGASPNWMTGFSPTSNFRFRVQRCVAVVVPS
jgi:hypothetical protein